MQEKYMAYVGSYSYNGKAKGITCYDVDVESGSFKYRCEVEVDNASYVTVSHKGDTLYSIADEGVVAFRILPNGGLSRLNSVNIKGMRGTHISTDKYDHYMFISGYHDGKETVLRLNEDGSVGEITDGVYHQGLGTVAERTFRPHMTCCRRTPGGAFVMIADTGIDQVKIYRFDSERGKLTLVDAIRCERESGPRHFLFSSDNRFIYLMYENKNVIDVFTYNYEPGMKTPEIEKIQTIPTFNPKSHSQLTAACTIRMPKDEEHLFCSNAGDNSICVYKRDKESGILTYLFCLPISGDYPKNFAVFPDQKHIVSLNHASNSLTFFKMDYENNLLVMCQREIPVNEPNCCAIVKIPGSDK